MKRSLLALAVATSLFGVPGIVFAQDASPEAQYRQSLMQAFRLHTGAIRATLGGAAPAGHVERHAVAFNEMAQAVANAFPEGSGGEGSRALPAIWENRMAFMNEVSGVQSAAAELVAAARSGDGDRISAAVAAVGGTCSSCHGTYRAR